MKAISFTSWAKAPVVALASASMDTAIKPIVFCISVSLDVGPLGPAQLLLHGSGGEAGDEVALQEHDDDHDRQDSDERRCHQLVPDHFLLAEEGEEANRQRHEFGLGVEGQREDELLGVGA